MDNDLPPLNGWSRAEEMVRWRLNNQDERLDNQEKDLVRLKEVVDKLPGRIAISVLTFVVGILSATATAVVLRVTTPDREPPPEVRELIETIKRYEAKRNLEVNK